MEWGARGPRSLQAGCTGPKSLNTIDRHKGKGLRTVPGIADWSGPRVTPIYIMLIPAVSLPVICSWLTMVTEGVSLLDIACLRASASFGSTAIHNLDMNEPTQSSARYSRVSPEVKVTLHNIQAQIG